MAIHAQPRQTEKEYRAIPVDSASTIKEFLTDPKKYFTKYVMGEIVEEEDSKSAIIGSLVHCLLLDSHSFDDKYMESTCSELPTAKMLEFTNALYEETISHVEENEEGDLIPTLAFEDLAQIAYNKVGFSWKLNTVLEKWREGTGEVYYDQILASRPRGLQVVTEVDMKISEGIISTLKGDDFLYELVNQESTDDIDVYTEMKLEGQEFHIYGLPAKGMIDKLIIYHAEKRIMILDLKVIWEVTNFFEGYYLYRRSYIQAFVYWELVKIWAKENGFEDYEIEFPKFIVCDSGNYYKPLLYELSSEAMVGANSGFTHKGKFYKGVHDIVTDLKWAREKNEWKINRTDYINKGVIII